MRVAEAIEIRRTIDEVWAFVADRANDPRWCQKVKSVELLGPGRWRVMHKPVPLRPPAVLMVEQLGAEPPHRLRLREEDDASVFEVEYKLEVAGGGTRLTQVSEFECKSLPRWLQPFFARGVMRDVRGQLRELRRVLEAPT